MSSKRMTKGKMARQLVYFCVGMLTQAAVFSEIMLTVSAVTGFTVDLSSYLTFMGVAFGGELLMLLLKRVFAKDISKEE